MAKKSKRNLKKKYGKKVGGIFRDANSGADSTRVSFRPDDPARTRGRGRNVETIFRRQNVRRRAFERTLFGQSDEIRKQKVKNVESEFGLNPFPTPVTDRHVQLIHRNRLLD